MVKFFSDSKKNNEYTKSAIYERYGKKLYGYAVTKWNLDEDDAWDIIYKTIDKTVETIDRYSFETEKKFGSFIFKIFINYLRNHYRDKMSKLPDTILFDENRPFSDQPVNESKEDDVPGIHMKILEEELEMLEDWQRILLLMRAQNYSYREIAEYVSKPEEQLKVYHMRCLKKITEQLNSRINNQE